MKFEELQKLWSSDCDIDETELSQESVKIPQLHNKYLIYFHDERLRLRNATLGLTTSANALCTSKPNFLGLVSAIYYAFFVFIIVL